MKQKIIIISVVAAVVLAVVFGLSFTNKKSVSIPSEILVTQITSTDDPIDVVLDFYGDWLDAVQSTSTDPYQEGLPNEPLLSPALRDKLNNPPSDQLKDPVLCQDPLPTKIRSKRLLEKPDEMQFVIFSKEQPLAGQAIATTRKLNDGWYIDDIYCAREFDEPREFTFEYEGNLLKSVPPPYDPQNWHLVYAREGVNGDAVPLFFSAESMCTDQGGIEAVCNEAELTETQKVMLRGNMTDLGVEVKKLQFLE